MTDTIDRALERLRPLETAANRAWWEAAVRGGREEYARVEEVRNRIDALLADPELWEALEARHADPPEDPIEARIVRLLRLEALPRQVDPGLSERMNRLATEIERAFSVHRPEWRGSPRTANDLQEVLVRERDGETLEGAWEALMTVGPPIADRLRELARLRNEAARAVGFDDFYLLRLALQEQDADELETLFDRLDEMTREPFAVLKAEIDERLAARCGIDPGDLMPWHYHNEFFQQAPDVFGANLDAVYAEVDVLDAAAGYFRSIGLPVEEILARSSLHEADGKDPHAFAVDIDREGDVRILLNLRPTERWMGTTLHELGHAVYDEGIARDLPWSLRRPAHTLTTEAIAMIFGRLPKSAEWMTTAGALDRAAAGARREPAARELRAQMLVFSRWAQVMKRFERELYRDPEGDLNAVWWDLKRRYQGLTPPERPDGAADWAAKIHIAVAPVYYHNYLLGECFASQVHAAMAADLGGGDPLARADGAAGTWLGERIFAPGARHHYDELARRATGAPLSPDAFAAQFLAPVAG